MNLPLFFAWILLVGPWSVSFASANGQDKGAIASPAAEDDRQLLSRANEELQKEWREAGHCAECKLVDGESVLCEVHRGRMERQYNALWDGWEEADEHTKAHRVMVMGKLAYEHRNVPSPQLVEVLLRCLETERGWHVRSTCARVVGYHKNPSAFEGAMIGMVKEAHGAMKKLMRKESALLARKFEGVPVAMWIELKSPPPGDRRVLARYKKALNELGVLTLEAAKHSLQLQAAMSGLRDVPSEEALNALCRIMRNEKGNDCRRAIMEIAKYKHSPQLWRSAIQRMKVVEGPLKKITKRGQKILDSKLPKQPKGWPGSPTEWREEAKRKQSIQVRLVLHEAEPFLRELQGLDKGLRTFAEHLGMPGPAVKDHGFYRAWSRWESQQAKRD